MAVRQGDDMRYLIFALALTISHLAQAEQVIYKCIDPKTKRVNYSDQECSKIGQTSAGQLTVVSGNTAQTARTTTQTQQVTQSAYQTSGYQQSSAAAGSSMQRENDQCQRLKDEKEAIKNNNDEWSRKRYGELAYQINKTCR